MWYSLALCWSFCLFDKLPQTTILYEVIYNLERKLLLSKSDHEHSVLFCQCFCLCSFRVSITSSLSGWDDFSLNTSSLQSELWPSCEKWIFNFSAWADFPFSSKGRKKKRVTHIQDHWLAALSYLTTNKTPWRYKCLSRVPSVGRMRLQNITGGGKCLRRCYRLDSGAWIEFLSYSPS